MFALFICYICIYDTNIEMKYLMMETHMINPFDRIAVHGH